MSDLIKLLPDSVANQIAAGEVVQRPASVVKELVENAVDAGSSSITVNIQEGGREIIHVIDNGCGLSPADALRAFERHATSKISSASDLYNLSTFGFRGEALASIASVAEVELRTRRKTDETGIQIIMNGGSLAGQSAINTPVGAQFFIRNLFYNIPARRKFLKSNSVETKHIIAEFSRIALCNPQIEMKLYNNGTCIYNLPPQNLRQRIVSMAGRHMNASLLELSVETSIISLHGFIGAPQSARKSGAEQYFFVNNRYFKCGYFHKSVMEAYKKLIPPDVQPPYFIYMTIDPSRIDVNIHPSKTEIKFEDEQAIWQIIGAAVRESLGKLGAVPMMDFDTEPSIEIPVYNETDTFREPSNFTNDSFNPFDTSKKVRHKSILQNSMISRSSTEGWEVLYKDDYDSFDHSTSDTFRNFISPESPGQQSDDLEFESQGMGEDAAHPEFDEFEDKPSAIEFIRLGGRYVAAKTGAEMAIIDLARAHNRVLYEKFIDKGVRGDYNVNQQELFPEPVELSSEDIFILGEARSELSDIGFDIAQHDDNSVILKSIPADMANNSAHTVIDSILSNLKSGKEWNRSEKTARIMAETYTISNTRTMTDSEINELLLALLNCREPMYTTAGKPTMTVFTTEEIMKRLK